MNNTFSNHITTDSIDFKYARGASDRNGREFHNFSEIIYFLGGDVDFISDNIHTKLIPKCLVVVPKDAYHQVIINGNPEEYHRCIFNFSDIDGLQALISQKFKNVYICNVNRQQKYLIDKMIELTTGSSLDQKTKSEVLRSVLTLLLTELAPDDGINLQSPLSITTHNAIELINQRLCKNTSVSDIAAKLNISVSGLAHTFKNEMHISIYKYILKKRLLLAHEKLLLGKPSTEVAAECGFGDYSGFYKIYKKEFGTSPSQAISVRTLPAKNASLSEHVPSE